MPLLGGVLVCSDSLPRKFVSQVKALQAKCKWKRQEYCLAAQSCETVPNEVTKNLVDLSSMATIKLNRSIRHFCNCFGKTILTRVDWEEFKEFQNTLGSLLLHNNNTIQFEVSILILQHLSQIWSVKFDSGHTPFV